MSLITVCILYLNLYFVYVNVFSNLSHLFMGSCFGLAQTIYLPVWDSRGHKDINSEKKI